MPRSINRKLPQNQQQYNDQSSFSSLPVRTPETSRKQSILNNNMSDEDSRQPNFHYDENKQETNLSVINENIEFNNIQNSNNLEKYFGNSDIFKDFFRQGLLSFKNSSSEDDSSKFRICTLNVDYQLCKSYPALFLVPKHAKDECLKKNSKFHRQNRYKIY